VSRKGARAGWVGRVVERAGRVHELRHEIISHRNDNLAGMTTHSLPRAQRTSITYLSTIVSRLGLGGLTEIMGAEGFTRSHFTAISALAEFGPLAQSELADRTHLNRGHLVGFLDQLSARGLVTRTPDPGDRRRNIVALTGEGEAFTRRVAAAEQANEERTFAMLDESQREALRVLLRTVIDGEAPVAAGEPA
jgi:DNA-binding MarR family transcriptional regulator